VRGFPCGGGERRLRDGPRAPPAPAKYALSKLFDWFSPAVRLPIVECSDAAKAAVDKAMEIAGIAA